MPPAPSSIEIREPANDDELEQYYALRYEILRRPQGLAPGSERDEEIESASLRLIAILDDKIIGATALAPGMGRDEATGERYLYVWWRAMAIDNTLQRSGVGRAMYEEVERRAREMGAREVTGNARDDKLLFFDRLGFKPTGQGENLMGIPHTKIVKQL